MNFDDIPTPETDEAINEDRLINTAVDLERRLAVAREAILAAVPDEYTFNSGASKQLREALTLTAPKP